MKPGVFRPGEAMPTSTAEKLAVAGALWRDAWALTEAGVHEAASLPDVE
jgi:hypothetical protein